MQKYDVQQKCGRIVTYENRVTGEWREKFTNTSGNDRGDSGNETD